MHTQNVKVSPILEGNWQKLVNVKRLCTENVVRPISVADHSWMTAMVVMQLLDNFADTFPEDETRKELIKGHGKTRARAIEKALLHDIEECIIGDVPKIRFTNDDAARLKITASKLVSEHLFHDEHTDYTLTRQSAKLGLSGIVVGYADLYALMIELIREINMGNRGIEFIARKVQYLIRHYYEHHEYKVDTRIPYNALLMEYLKVHGDKTHIHLYLHYNLTEEAW